MHLQLFSTVRDTEAKGYLVWVAFKMLNVPVWISTNPLLGSLSNEHRVSAMNYHNVFTLYVIFFLRLYLSMIKRSSSIVMYIINVKISMELEKALIAI